MFEVTLPAAEFWFALSNVALVVGTLIIAAGTYGVFTMGSVKERFADERISSNEMETARANESADKARRDTSMAQERIANLTADNLALQTVLLPRHFGLIGIDGPPKGQAWAASLAKFAGTAISIQVVDDAEAKNLAMEVIILLSMSGWKAELIDEKRSNFATTRIPDGVNVSYPIGIPWTEKAPNQPWMAWANAAESLANALTEAGFGVGNMPVSRYGFLDDARNALQLTTAHFDPPLTGVYLQIGARPVAPTVEWIKGGRLDPLGNPPASSSNPQ